MRGPLAAVPIALGFAWMGCRQLAGIEDIEPSVSDAAARDARATDASDAEAGSLGVDGASGCGCPGCTMLAEGLNLPASLVVEGGYVYFLNYGPEDGQGSLMRVSAGGGSPETVVGGLTRPLSIASDGNSLYWQAEDGKGGGIVEKRALAGGTTRTLASGLSTLQSVVIQSTVQFPLTNNIALTPTDVYFVGYSAGIQAGILSVPVDGGTVSTLIDQFSGDAGAAKALSVNGIVTDGSALYAVSNGSWVGILSVPLHGGPPSALAGNLVNPWVLTASGQDVFFLDVGLSGKSGTLQRVPKIGGPAKILLQKLTSPWAIVADQGVLYFAVAGGPTGGSVNAYDIASGEVSSVAPNLMSPVSVAVDAKNVYWTDFNCGAVLKAPR